MIVQSAPEGEAHFVITMLQHTAFAGELARHFGNDDFAPLDPREPLEYVVANHDRGWDELDARAPQDPATGLPYNLSSTPLTDIIATSAGSPDHNQRRHPLSGIISSMHSYGLYHGRYGLAPDKLFIDRIPDQLRPAADAMLEAELARQDRLREQLASDPTAAAWADDEVIFTAYKQLQFFDTFSLYCHLQPEGARGDAAFDHVPAGPGSDVTISVQERPGAVYALDPYPFDAEPLEAATQGRYLRPQPPGADLAAVLASTPVREQAVTLVAA